jgi:hypothetical protein
MDVTFRQTAVDELKRYLKSSEPFQAAFILAGAQPTVLEDRVDNIPQAASVLDRWRCLSPIADMDRALTTAGQMADGKARILLISDHLHNTADAAGQLESWSVGRPLDNIGFLHADRLRTDDGDRCMLTIGNFSTETKTTRLKIESLDGSQTLYEQSVEIPPSEPFRMIFEPSSGIDLAASIDDDALDTDNRVILLGPSAKPVHAAVDFKDEEVSESVHNALEAIPAARLVTESPDLLITDRTLPETTEPLPWTMRIISEPNAVAFMGPFITDRSHPLTDGIDLQGVIWSAAIRQGYPSIPVIAAGNTSLLEDVTDRNRAHHLRLYLNPELSTFQLSPNWPILFWNLVHWRQQQLPGLSQTNWRLGAQVEFEAPQDAMQLKLLCPDGRSVDYDPQDQTIVINADAPGVYRMDTNNGMYSFAVNALAADESDLQACRFGHLTPPDQSSQFWWEYRPYDWILLLVAMGLLSLHGILIFKQSKGANA